MECSRTFISLVCKLEWVYVIHLDRINETWLILNCREANRYSEDPIAVELVLMKIRGCVVLPRGSVHHAPEQWRGVLWCMPGPNPNFRRKCHVTYPAKVSDDLLKVIYLKISVCTYINVAKNYSLSRKFLMTFFFFSHSHQNACPRLDARGRRTLLCTPLLQREEGVLRKCEFVRGAGGKDHVWRHAFLLYILIAEI